ncbi:DUF1800 domain-containing protein [Photobacterium sp. DA100]|uniref:DUF1800 domain-containing protein n=1 Tax=Photobacterium sp. DA100 TaxID=3027472 RepID=UPI002479E2E7|nr:DUF1800 domain-containing protein [Photobacterium sp. DA100]WEM43632.1 DUF1800 domain-containing protein [Photobacterium sp. DA100]
MVTTINDPIQAAKFLYRSTFGPKNGDVEKLLDFDGGIDGWFEDQYARQNLHLSLARKVADDTGTPLNESARMSAWWQRSLVGGDQLRQRVAYALSQIFVVSNNGGPGGEGLASYYDVLVRNAFERFDVLLKAVTLHPAMGQFLTLAGSRAHDEQNNTYPDENYAREVMQLFSIGLWELKINGQPQLDGEKTKPAYTQQDVEELARVLTGWRKDKDSDGKDSNTKPMVNNADWHDDGAKSVLGVDFPAGQSAEQDLDQAIKVLYEHPNTPVFISRLLIQRLTISNPRRSYIERVARIFIDDGQGVRGNMKAVIKAILLDEDLIEGHAMADYQGFGFSTRNFGKVKEPVIAMTNLCRALNVKSNDPRRWWDFPGLQSNFGQAPLQAPSVFNFYEPDYAPKGEIANKELTAPEFNIHSMDSMRRISNKMWGLILSHRLTGVEQWTWDRSPLENRVDKPEEYMAWINERIFFGLMSDELHQYIEDLLIKMTEQNIGTDRRTFATLFAIQCSPDFRCQE